MCINSFQHQGMISSRQQKLQQLRSKTCSSRRVINGFSSNAGCRIERSTTKLHLLNSILGKHHIETLINEPSNNKRQKKSNSEDNTNTYFRFHHEEHDNASIVSVESPPMNSISFSSPQVSFTEAFDYDDNSTIGTIEDLEQIDNDEIIETTTSTSVDETLFYNAESQGPHKSSCANHALPNTKNETTLLEWDGKLISQVFGTTDSSVEDISSSHPELDPLVLYSGLEEHDDDNADDLLSLPGEHERQIICSRSRIFYEATAKSNASQYTIQKYLSLPNQSLPSFLSPCTFQCTAQSRKQVKTFLQGIYQHINN
mmetsp:Transcript_11817/g.18310  ORF Transcript_11817/g.18310 Transcript_11817/m.18310 type:complete len:314 (+) Transcript_11817:94-1035(+)